jgi:hypothetical protein
MEKQVQLLSLTLDQSDIHEFLPSLKAEPCHPHIGVGIGSIVPLCH